MRRVLLDSNTLDPLLTQVGAWVLDEAVKSAKLAVLFTHVTIDEIAATPDRGKRQRLLNLLVFPGQPIPASVMVLDFARLDFCRLIARRRSSSGLDTQRQSPYRCGSIV